MIIEGTRRSGELRDRADVVVVGTGAGGGTLAAYLSDRGWDVVMLDRGGFYRAEDFHQREREAMGEFNGRRGMDTSDDSAIFINYARAIGGTTIHYWGDSFRTPHDRLERWRARHGIDWMTPAALDPHFEAIEQELGIHVAGESLFNENNRLVRQGCDALGVEGAAVPTARVDCISCGWTQFGCAYNRKTSQLITTIPRVSRAGGRVYSDARVDSILIDNGRARGVEGALLDRESGRPKGRFRVDADIVVLAGGALGTAELLLRSTSDAAVGKRLYINPHYWVFADFGREIDNVTGIPTAYAVHEWRSVRRNDNADYAAGGYIMLCSHQQPGVVAAMLAETGAAHAERMSKFRHLGSLMSVIDEEHPGTVTLRGGRHRISYRVRGVDALKAVDYLKNASRIFLAAGAREVWVPDIYGTVVKSERDMAGISLRSVMPNAQFAAGSHLMGSAPIGTDPTDSFAGPTGEAHRLRGLYVADGAALPGSVSVDPSLTIMAVARHVAAGLHASVGASGAS